MGCEGRLVRHSDVRVRLLFFFSSRRRHTRLQGDWSSDVCSSDLSLSEAHRFIAGDRAERLGERGDERLGQAVARVRAIEGEDGDAALVIAEQDRSKIGRASCRERVKMAVVGVAVKTKYDEV